MVRKVVGPKVRWSERSVVGPKARWSEVPRSRTTMAVLRKLQIYFQSVYDVYMIVCCPFVYTSYLHHRKVDHRKFDNCSRIQNIQFTLVVLILASLNFRGNKILQELISFSFCVFG